MANSSTKQYVKQSKIEEIGYWKRFTQTNHDRTVGLTTNKGWVFSTSATSPTPQANIYPQHPVGLISHINFGFMTGGTSSSNTLDKIFTGQDENYTGPSNASYQDFEEFTNVKLYVKREGANASSSGTYIETARTFWMNDIVSVPEFNMTSYLEIPYSPRLNTPNYTITLWAYPTNISSGWETLWITRVGTTYLGSNLYLDSSTKRWNMWSGNGSSWTKIYGPVRKVNTWQHITCVNDNSDSTQKQKLYVNGSLVGTSNATLMVNTTNQFSIGIYTGGTGSAFIGKMYDFRYYNRALTQSEIHRIVRKQEVFNDEVLRLPFNTTKPEHYVTSSVKTAIDISNNGLSTVKYQLPEYMVTRKANVYKESTSNVYVADYFQNLNRNGYTPHYVQVNKSYTDLSYNVTYTRPQGQLTWTNTFATVDFSDVELTTNVTQTLYESYYAFDNSYVDVYVDLNHSRIVDISRWLELSIAGLSPHYVQLSKPYVDTSINVVDHLTDGTLVHTNAFNTTGASNVTFTSSLVENYTEIYNVQNAKYVDVHDNISLSVEVNEWMDISLAGLNPHYVQVHKPYTDASVNFQNSLLPGSTTVTHSNLFHTSDASNVTFTKDICQNYLEVYNIQNNTHPDVHVSITRDVSVNQWFDPVLIRPEYNPHYIQRGHVYTDLSINSNYILPGGSYTDSHVFHKNDASNVSFGTDFATSFLEVYSMTDDTNVDVYEDISRNISIDDWFVVTLNGDNPRYVQEGKAYIDPSVNIVHDASNILGTTFTLAPQRFSNNQAAPQNAFDITNAERGTTVEGVYIETYSLTDDFYIDVSLDVVRTIRVDDYLNLSLVGSNPYKVQWKYTPYLDRGITITSTIPTNSQNFTVDTSFNQLGINQLVPRVNIDTRDIYIETYSVVNQDHTNVFEDISRNIFVDNWISLSLNNALDDHHFVQVGGNYTDYGVNVVNAAQDSNVLTSGLSSNLNIQLDALLDDPSYNIDSANFERTADAYGVAQTGQLFNELPVDICGTYMQTYKYIDNRNPELLYVNVARDISVNNWIKNTW